MKKQEQFQKLDKHGTMKMFLLYIIVEKLAKQNWQLFKTPCTTAVFSVFSQQNKSFQLFFGSNLLYSWLHMYEWKMLRSHYYEIMRSRGNTIFKP